MVKDLEQTPEGPLRRDRHDTSPRAKNKEMNCPSTGKYVSAYREVGMSASSWAVTGCTPSREYLRYAHPVMRMDGWQRVYALSLILLVAVSSASEALASVAYYPRLAAVGLLAVWTWAVPTDHHTPLAERGLAVRWLVAGLWGCTGVAVASTAWSVAPFDTATQALMLGFITAIIHGALTRRWASTADAMADLAVGFWVVTTALAVSILAYLAQIGEARSSAGRMHGIFDNPNMAGFLAALTVPLGFALYRHGSSRWIAASTVLVLVALILSQSRTPLVALAVAAVWVIARSGHITLIKTVYVVSVATVSHALLTALLGAGLLPQGSDNVFARFTANEGGDLLNTRSIAWDQAIIQWEGAPWGGVGYGASPAVLRSMLGSWAFQFSSESVHNSYLQWFMETGLAGVLPLTFVLVAAGCVAVLAPRRTPSFALAGLVVVGLVIQMGESSMFGTGQPYPYLFWLAVAAGALSTGGQGASKPTEGLELSSTGNPEDIRRASSTTPLLRRAGECPGRELRPR